MKRTKIIGLALVAVCAMSAVASASASAHQFEHNGTAVTTSLATTSKSTSAFVLESGTVKIECASQSATGTVEAGGKDKSSAISFKTCKLLAPTNCKLSAAQETEILTVTTATELTEEGSPKALVDKFTPSPSTEPFVTINIVNNPSGCALVGAHPVKGFSSGKVNNATESLEFSSAYGGLTFSGAAATLTGTTKVTLNNAEKLTAS